MRLLKEYIKLLIEQEINRKPKVIFMAGAPGSGKSTIRNLLNLSDFQIVDPDEAYEAALKVENVPLNVGKFELEFFDINNQMKDALEAGDQQKIEEIKPEYERLRAIAQKKGKAFTMSQKWSKDRQKALAKEGKDFIVDGTAADYNAINSLRRTFEEAGYETAMLFVHLDLEYSLERNRARGEAGGRSLRDRTIEKNWIAVHENESRYRELFGDHFFYVDASDMGNTVANIKNQVKAFVN
jgi:predicted ABC-type ATPase